MPAPRLDVHVSGGHVYSIEAEVALDVYVYEIDGDDAPEVRAVRRFKTGGLPGSGRDIDRSRQKVDAGDMIRGGESAPPDDLRSWE